MTHLCKWCNKPIPAGANPRAAYCPPERGEVKSKCKAAAENHRFYERHKDRIIAATLANRARRSAFGKPINVGKMHVEFKARVLSFGGNHADFMRIAPALIGAKRNLEEVSDPELQRLIAERPAKKRRRSR